MVIFIVLWAWPTLRALVELTFRIMFKINSRILYQINNFTLRCLYSPLPQLHAKPLLLNGFLDVVWHRVLVEFYIFDNAHDMQRDVEKTTRCCCSSWDWLCLLKAINSPLSTFWMPRKKNFGVSINIIYYLLETKSLIIIIL